MQMPVETYPMSSPPLPPRTFSPLREQNKLLNCDPFSATADNSLVSSPPLFPRTISPVSEQEELFRSVPPPASAGGFPVPVPRTSLKKQATSPPPTTVMDHLLPPPVRSRSSPVFAVSNHYWTLADLTDHKTTAICRYALVVSTEL